MNISLNTRDNMIKELSTKIHDLMSQNFYYLSSDLDLLKKTTFLIDELLSDKQIMDKFHKLLSHLPDSDIKIKVFSMIRNILAHFPIYNFWEDIYLNEAIVTWNNPKYPERLSIKSFFDTYEGMNLSYDVYFRLPYESKIEKYVINFNVPSLKQGFYLKDFISIKDLYYTFFLIDYLLEDLGISTQINCPPSM